MSGCISHLSAHTVIYIVSETLVINPLSVNPTKCLSTLKQFVGKVPTNCLSVFNHFWGLVLKGLRFSN